MSTEGISEYELERLERIKENKKLILELFPEGTQLHQNNTKLSKRSLTPDEDPVYEPAATSRVTRRKLQYRVPRKNPKRGVVDPAYYDGPITRGMRSRCEGGGGERELLGGIEDEGEVKRVVYRATAPKRRKIMEETLLPVELDGLPPCSQRLLRNVAYISTKKVYDRHNGTTCHQCRQKTKDQKTICHNKNCGGVKGQFCGPCLKNRYGEDIKEKLLDSEWVCPPCRGKCNCSFCLPKKGCPPTGIMIHIAKEAGFDSVQEYLERSNYDY